MAEDIDTISLLQQPHVSPDRVKIWLTPVYSFLPKFCHKVSFEPYRLGLWSSFRVFVVILILFSMFWLIRCPKSVVNIWVIKLFWCCKTMLRRCHDMTSLPRLADDSQLTASEALWYDMWWPVLWCCQDQSEAFRLQNQFLNQEILELSRLLQQDRKQAARWCDFMFSFSFRFLKCFISFCCLWAFFQFAFSTSIFWQ